MKTAFSQRVSVADCSKAAGLVNWRFLWVQASAPVTAGKAMGLLGKSLSGLLSPVELESLLLASYPDVATPLGPAEMTAVIPTRQAPEGAESRTWMLCAFSRGSRVGDAAKAVREWAADPGKYPHAGLPEPDSSGLLYPPKEIHVGLLPARIATMHPEWDVSRTASAWIGLDGKESFHFNGPEARARGGTLRTKGGARP